MFFDRSRILFILAFFICCAVYPHSVSTAQTLESLLEIEDFTLSADRVKFAENPTIIEASGDVAIESGELRIYAVNLQYSQERRDFKLSGNVRLRLPQLEIDAGELTYNCRYHTLVAQNAVIRLKEKVESDCSEAECCRNRAVFTAASLKRDNNGKWSISDGTFTACDCGAGEKASWKIGADKIEAGEDNSALAHNPRFYIRDTPVFALPAALFPLSSRRSGFLAPRFSYTDANGFRVGEDYFWAFERSADATFGLDFMHKRGFKTSAETRYNFGNASGDFNAFYLPDWSAEPADYEFNRFKLEGRHLWDSGGVTVQKIKLEMLSDTRIPQHFGRDWRERSLDYAESKQMWEFSFSEISLGFSSSLHQSLSQNLRADGWLWDMNGNSPTYVLNRLSADVPAAAFAGGHVLASLRNSADLVHSFGQDAWQADDDSPPPLADVSALFDFEPELAFPFNFSDVIEATPKMSYRQKFFVTDDYSSEKGYAALGLDLKSRIWRVFDTKHGALKHEMVPGLSWRWLPFIYDGTDKSRTDRKLRLLEYPDESISPHYAEARLSNRLVLRRGDYGNGTLYRFFEMNLIQRVFIESVSDDPQHRRFDDGRAELILRAPRAEWKNQLGLRWNDGRVQSARSLLTLGPLEGVSFGAEYFLLEKGPLLGEWLYQRPFDDEERFHQVGGNLVWTFAKSFTLGYFVDVSIEEARLIEQRWLAGYRSKCNCWGIELSAAHRPGMNFPDVFLNIDLDFM